MTDKTKRWLPFLIGFLIILALILAAVYWPKDDTTPKPAIDPTPTETTDPATPEMPKTVPPGSTPDIGATGEIFPEDAANLGRINVPGLTIGMAAIDAEDVIERVLKPETTGGNRTYSARRTPQTAAGYSMMAFAGNIPDDSLKAQEIIAMFKPDTDGGFVLSEYTSRVQCRRGANTTDWQVTICP